MLKDLSAGVIVGIVALPLAIAFAIASGVSPEKGLVTAIIAGAIISAFGGSRVQIGGPTGAFIVIVYAIVQEHGVNGLTIATLMAGILLIIMGYARLGNLLKFIPFPLIVGFTSGIGVIIFSSQLKDFFGFPIHNLPADFISKWEIYLMNTSYINWSAVIIGFSTILITFNFYRITTKIPGTIAAIILSTAVVYWMKLPVDTIETTFGNIPNLLPKPIFPSLDFYTVKNLIQPAFAIALLGGIESLLSAVVADGMIGSRHRSNAELIAQGAANCFSALFGGIPATGAIARTVTNVNNGGRTPIAGITHAFVLLLIMMLLAPLAKLIPMACLAGILITVAYHMSEWRQFRSLLKGSKLDIMILLVTFFLTVVFDLVIAIEIGIVLSSFVLMKRFSDSFSVENAVNLLPVQNGSKEKLFEDEIPQVPQGVVLFELNGALFFGVALTFEDTINRLHELPKVLILRMRNVPFVDATGIHRIKETIRQFKQKGVCVIISGANQKVKNDLERNDIYSVLDRNKILKNIDESLQAAREIIEKGSR